MKRFRESFVILVVAACALLVFARAAQAASPAGGQDTGSAMMESASGCPCDCDCDACGKGCACGPAHSGHGMRPMMEGMKKHMEEVKASVAALRAHETKLEAISDPAEFRKEAVEHFRMLDSLHESHLKHMESMMGGRGRGHHGHGHHGR